MGGAHVERLKGTVKWFNNAKGYGFLGRDEGPDVFIHYSSITTEGYKSLQEGDKVEFEIVQGQKGPQAANVTKIAEAEVIVRSPLHVDLACSRFVDR